MGTVVNILYSPYNLEGAPITKPNIYEIDDGTGVLRVVHWPNNFKTTDGKIGGKTPFEIGTTVEVRGMTQFFREKLEIKALPIFNLKILLLNEIMTNAASNRLQFLISEFH